MSLSRDFALVRGIVLALFAGVLLFAAIDPPHAYASDPLAERSVNLRIKRDEVDFLVRSGQITTREERYKRLMAIAAEEKQLAADFRRRPQDQQAAIRQEAERLYQIRSAPLRVQWERKIDEYRNAAIARDRMREQDLPGDVDRAARIQVTQNAARERMQRGEIPQAQYARDTQQAEAAILALQHKYDGYGPSWGNRFSHDLSVRTTYLLKNPTAALPPPVMRTPAPPVAQPQSSASSGPPPPPPPQIGAAPGAKRDTTAKAPPPPPPRPAQGSAWLTWVFWLSILTAGGFFGYRRFRRSSTPTYSNSAIEYASAPSLAEKPEPQVVQRGEPRAAPAAAATAASEANIKERLFAEQRAKYQARYNDLMDEVTAASAELMRMAPIVTTLQANLAKLSKSVQNRFGARVMESNGGVRGLLMNGLLLKPLFHLFMQLGIVGKIVFGTVVLTIVNVVGGGLGLSSIPVALLLYTLLVAVFVFNGRRAQMRGPQALLKKNTDHFKSVRLACVYEGQAPHASSNGPAYIALSVGPATGKRSATEDVSVPALSDPVIGPGTFLLGIGELAAYRLERTGATTRVSASNADVMTQYGNLLTEVLGDQPAFAAASCEPLVCYSQVAWRKRKAAAEAPALERLVTNVDRLEQLWRDTYVSDKVFPFLLRRIDLFNVRDRATPSGILLYGYEGNGKAHLAQKIAASISARFERIDPNVLGSVEDVKALWQKSRGKDPVVLFVDYAERVFPRPGSQNAGTGTREGTLAFITEWGRYNACDSRVWVVLSAESDEGLHAAVLTEIGGSKIKIEPPDTAGRELVLRGACRENDLHSLPGWLIAETAGASVDELRRIVQETRLLSIPNPPEDVQWQEALKTVRGADGIYRDPANTWDRLVLPAEIKEQLQSACKAIQNPERYRKKGAGIPNLLLFGPPGTGKTQIARTIANEGGVRFFEASLADLKSKWTGESAHLVKDMFAKAREKAPSVLFLDEIDAVAAKRGGDSDAFTKDIVTQLLREMEGVEKQERAVFVLGATNLLQDIDPAIKSRFTDVIEIPLPDEAERRELLARYIGDCEVDPALDVAEVAATLAKGLNRKSGRDLKKLVERAMTRAMRTPAEHLTRELLMAEVTPRGKEISDGQLQNIWSQIVLKQDVKDTIVDQVRLFNSAGKAAPRGLLLYGPPGTGKSEIGRRIADSTGSQFKSLSGADLKAGYVGQTGEKVQKLWQEARALGRCVLFIDECEGVFARRGGTSADAFTNDLVDEFIQKWDGVDSEGLIWVIGATNRRELIDDAVMSRFETVLKIDLPGASERQQILTLELRKLESAIAPPAFIERETAGFAGRDLKSLATDIYRFSVAGRGAVTDEVWRQAIERQRKKTSTEADENARWDTLVLADETLKQLQVLCESLSHIETLQKQGMTPPKGALLYGPPGTGKSQIARTLANESGLAFFAAAPSDVKAAFEGQSGKLVREMFERARAKAPCIMFIDEFDAGATSRTGDQSSAMNKEIVNELIAQMDGAAKTTGHVFVLAATNHPELIDEALMSRFRYKIEVPPPGQEQRGRLFKIFLSKKYRLEFDVDVVSRELAERCGNLSGRDIQNFVERAEQRAWQRALERNTPDNVVMSRDDLIAELAPAAGRTVSQAQIDEAWSEIVLKPDVKASILSKLKMFNDNDPAAPRGLLLYGPSGTGKTEVARCIAKSTSSKFMGLSGSELKAGYTGQTGKQVKARWDEARAYGRCVMFVDECDAVFGRRGGIDSDAFTNDLVTEFLQQWDGIGSKGQIWVVGATNRRELLDEAIVSRFGAAVEIGLPQARERQEILRLEMHKLKRPVEIPDFLGAATTGFSGRDLAQVARDVCGVAAARGSAITPDMWSEVVLRYAKATSTAVDDTARWDSLILPEPTLRRLRRVCDSLKRAEMLRQQGYDVPHGVLVYGPSGTGKTQIARTIANESGLSFIAAGPADIKGAYTGHSGRNVQELFQRARAKSPSILFIDEIDAGAASRTGGKADQFTDEIVGALLEEMGGVKKNEQHVFVLAATNHPRFIDASVLSRFEEQIEIPNPGPDEIARLIKLFIGKRAVDFDVDALATQLAARCSGMSGRDLQNLVRRASQEAIQRAFDQNGDRIVLTAADLIAQLELSPAALGAESRVLNA